MQLDRPGVQALRSKHFRSRFVAPETALTVLVPVLMRSISSADRAARDARSGKLSAAERSALNQAQCYKSYAWYPIQSTALDHPAPRVVAAFEALQSRNGG